MSEEQKDDLTPQPSSAPPLTDEEREAELKKIDEELKHDQEVKDAEMKEMLEKAKQMQENKQKTLLLEMIEIARSFNGFNYISASMITDVPKETKDQSLLLRNLLVAFMLRGGKSIEDFKKIYVQSGIVFIQAHKGLPTLGLDGLYSGFDPDGNVIPTKNVKQLSLCSDPKNFKPIIVARTGRDAEGKMTFGKLEGNPYHDLTAEEFAAVLKENGAIKDKPKETAEE